jgi:hypothetical protein
MKLLESDIAGHLVWHCSDHELKTRHGKVFVRWDTPLQRFTIRSEKVHSLKWCAFDVVCQRSTHTQHTHHQRIYFLSTLCYVFLSLKRLLSKSAVLIESLYPFLRSHNHPHLSKSNNEFLISLFPNSISLCTSCLLEICLHLTVVVHFLATVFERAPRGNLGRTTGMKTM